MWAVDFAQILIRSAGTGYGRAQFRPNQTIAGCQQRANDPSQHRLGATHRRDHQRNRYERPHADHVDHVQRGRAAQADSADELGVAGLWKRRHLSTGSDELLASNNQIISVVIPNGFQP